MIVPDENPDSEEAKKMTSMRLQLGDRVKLLTDVQCAGNYIARKGDVGIVGGYSTPIGSDEVSSLTIMFGTAREGFGFNCPGYLCHNNSPEGEKIVEGLGKKAVIENHDPPRFFVEHFTVFRE